MTFNYNQARQEAITEVFNDVITPDFIEKGTKGALLSKDVGFSIFFEDVGHRALRLTEFDEAFRDLEENIKSNYEAIDQLKITSDKKGISFYLKR